MLNDDQKGIFIPDYNDPKVTTYGLKEVKNQLVQNLHS